MDESPKQLIGEIVTPISMQSGSDEKHDYEYVRNGVCNIFMSNEPLSGKRYVTVTERKTKRDWACFIEEIAEQYKDAEKAKALWDRFQFVFTPKSTGASKQKMQE